MVIVFFNFDLTLYSREGNIIYRGNNDDGFWNGITNTGILFDGKLLPPGTYYYVLNLNDSLYPNPLINFVYVNY